MGKIVDGKSKFLPEKVIETNPEYDNQKSYGWTPEDDFVLNGNEFGILYQALKAEVIIVGGASQMQKVKAFEVLEEILKLAIKAGVAQELKTDQTEE